MRGSFSRGASYSSRAPGPNVRARLIVFRGDRRSPHRMDRRLAHLAGFVSLALLAAGCNASTTSAGTPDLSVSIAALIDAPPPPVRPALRGALEAVDEARIAATIAKLAGFRTRNSCSDPSPQGGAI